MPGCSPRGSRHPKSSGSSSLAITIRDMPAKPRLMRLPDGSRPTSARLRFTFPPILGPTGMMYTGYSSTPLLMQADQFQTRLIRDREGCKNEWHVVVKSGAACAGCRQDHLRSLGLVQVLRRRHHLITTMRTW